MGAVSLDDIARWRHAFDGIDEQSFAVVEDADAIRDLLASAFQLTLDGSPPAAAV